MLTDSEGPDQTARMFPYGAAYIMRYLMFPHNI